MVSKLRNNYLPELYALGIKRERPSVVTVNLTGFCNQRCIYCEIGSGIPSTSKAVLTYHDLTWIVDQTALNRIKRIALCGGEPFLFEGLIELVEYAGRKNIRCAITTNGMSAHHLSDNDLKILKDYNAEINISLDSFQEEIQSTTRGVKGSIQDAVRFAQRLMGFGIPITLLTVISTYNCHELSNTFRKAWELGIRQVLFQPVISVSNYPDRPAVQDKFLLNVKPEQIDILWSELKNILHFERTHRIKTNVYRIIPWIRQYLETNATTEKRWFFQDILQDFYCREIDAIIDITYDGGIQPCGLAKSSITIHEDRQVGLLSLWTLATEKLRNDMHSGKYHDFCNGCCHHFSRNMLASIVRHPVRNRKALFTVIPLIVSRFAGSLLKIQILKT